MFQVSMAHQKLNSSQIGSRLHQVGGEMVAYRVWSDALLDSRSHLLPNQQSQLFGATGNLRPVHLLVFGRQQTPAGAFQNGS
jgi:hypothetical protein